MDTQTYNPNQQAENQNNQPNYFNPNEDNTIEKKGGSGEAIAAAAVGAAVGAGGAFAAGTGIGRFRKC